MAAGNDKGGLRLEAPLACSVVGSTLLVCSVIVIFVVTLRTLSLIAFLIFFTAIVLVCAFARIAFIMVAVIAIMFSWSTLFVVVRIFPSTVFRSICSEASLSDVRVSV